MANALQIAGATGSKQTRYAPILIHKFFKGLWTQRNPFTDAGTAFLVEKFYSGTSFDGLIDGLNIELTNKLTLKRRPGASIYNSQTFQAINRFYEFRRTTGSPATESIYMMADTASQVFNATGPSTKVPILTKSGGGQTSFQSVGTTLYMGDGVDLRKWLQPGGWVAQTSLATTTYQIGTTIIDPAGFLQYLSAFQVGHITNVAVTGNLATFTFNNTNFSLSTQMTFTPTGLTGASFLNGQKLTALSVIPSGSNFIVTAFFVHAAYASAADSGTATTTDLETPATTGNSAPTFTGGSGGTTTDGLSTWTDYGFPTVYNWGPPAAPAQAPSLSSAAGLGQFVIWQANTNFNFNNLVLDSNGFVQQQVAGPGISGNTLPAFAVPTLTNIGTTSILINDGANLLWTPMLWLGNPVSSTPTAWSPGTHSPSSGANLAICVDSNGNLQMNTSGSGSTGGSTPSWNMAFGGTTTDGGLTWTNMGPWIALAFQGWKWGYSYLCVDGSVSSMSPLSPSSNGVQDGATVTGLYSTDPQVVAVWIFRTDDGGANPLFDWSIPNNHAGGSWSFLDQNPDPNLNFLIVGPQNGANNGPPQGFLPDCYHLGRIMGHVGNTVFYSAGPDTLVGNGNTAFPSGNNFVMPSLVNRIVPLAIGALIFTTSGCYFSGIGGTNLDTPTEPTPFMDGKLAGLLGYNALDVVGSTVYMVNSKKKGLQIDISTGEAEIAFAIGDVLAQGNGTYAAINPASCYVAWHEQDSTDSALYLATPNTPRPSPGWWYRMNPTPAPETGMMWSPIGVSEVGFSAFQSVETSPGIHQLLMGPPLAGPILYRDTTTYADNGTPYVAYADIGSVVLAHPGQVALLDFISTYCVAVGSRPTVSVLLGEIGGHAEMLTKGSALTIAVPEPPENGPYEASTLYNDRWWLSSTQESALCQHLQIEIAWPAENEPNELLSYALFGAHYQEL